MKPSYFSSTVLLHAKDHFILQAVLLYTFKSENWLNFGIISLLSYIFYKAKVKQFCGNLELKKYHMLSYTFLYLDLKFNGYKT